ncbi:MAG: ASPIC/UnbV domain-containing protein, partial [Planctomycetota bacterium]
NRDGRFEWYVTSVFREFPPPDNPGNMLYLNLGPHTYLEVSGPAGVNDGAWGWGTVAVDIDHDTWVDLLEVNGRLAAPWAGQPARLFHNNGNLTFSDIAATSGFDHADEGRSLAWLDADADGDLDVLVTTNTGALTYYRNETPDIGNWLRIVLDTSVNSLLAPNGFGTRVIATVGPYSYHRYLSSDPSYLATSEPVVHFGLDTATTVDELRIEWPKGYVTVMTDVPVNQHLTIVAPPLGDVNADGGVGVLDFLDMLAGWGPCPFPPDPCLADLDNDGQVGVVDFLILLANWS